MGVNIKPLSWGRKLAKEAIRQGKRGSSGVGGLESVARRSTRKKFADMAREFRKKG